MMKLRILVATKNKQGWRRNDFNWCKEGELVVPTFGIECDGERIDGFCGCKRAFIGLDSLKSTTTAKVVYTKNIGLLYNKLKKANRISGYNYPPKYLDIICSFVRNITRYFSIGEVVERRGDVICNRSICDDIINYNFVSGQKHRMILVDKDEYELMDRMSYKYFKSPPLEQ